MIVVGGAEVGTACLYVLGQSQAFADSMIFCVITGILSCILAFKMFVNVHQWIGAIDRLNEYDAKLRSADYD